MSTTVKVVIDECHAEFDIKYDNKDNRCWTTCGGFNGYLIEGKDDSLISSWISECKWFKNRNGSNTRLKTMAGGSPRCQKCIDFCSNYLGSENLDVACLISTKEK